MDTLYALKVIFRNFRKNLSISFINLGGLALSISVVLLLSAYCYSELNTDRHHTDQDRTYLITSEASTIHMPGVLTEYLHHLPAQFQTAVRVSGTWNPPAVKNEKGDVFESGLIFAEKGFFDLFTYPVLNGNIHAALNDPLSVILTSAEALRFFGTYDVIGKTLEIDNKLSVKVAAVIDETADKSFLKLKMIMPLSAIEKIQPDEGLFTDWTYWDFLTFVKLNKEIDPKQTASLIENIIAENSQGKTEPGSISLLPLKDIYFSDLDNAFMDYMVLGDKTKVLVLLMTALLVLLTALVNYLNIAAFRLYEQQLQTGIFKILGANRQEILKNTILESVLFFILSVLSAMVLIEISKPTIEFLTGLDYPDSLLHSGKFVILSLFVAIALGVIMSVFPAIKISRTGVVYNLKKKGAPKATIFQDGLVVFQFTVAIVLISFTLLVQKQIQFGTSDLGYNDENIISVSMTDQLNREVLGAELDKLPFVSSFSFSRFYPGKSTSYLETEIYDDGKEQIAGFDNFDADAKFADIMGIELTAGRFFNDTIYSDREKVVINESFIKAYNIQNPLGMTIRNKFEVIGVVKDFHYKSKNHAIGPLVMFNRGYVSDCLIAIDGSAFTNLQKSVENIRYIAESLSPDYPVEMSFIDQAVEQMYQSEIQFRRSFTFFAGCAIFISCIGVLALSLFTSLRKTKEIGIRKVNGAKTENILWLLNKKYIKQLLTAGLISVPVSWFMMEKWLSNFAYKTHVSWWIFAAGGGLVLLVTLITVSWQSLKTSAKKPVESLRYE